MGAGSVEAAQGPAGRGHAPWVRLCHWAIAASVLTLGFSGIVILMAHPRLYWGVVGNDLTPAWLELPISRNHHHGGWGPPQPFFPGRPEPVSRVRIYDIFNQNGWARSLHFLAAWGLVGGWSLYMAAGLLGGHVPRDILPRGEALSPAALRRDLLAHLSLRIPPAAGGAPYGPLQTWAYALVLCLGLPLMILTGLSMSPALGAAWPALPGVFGGPQSARSIHFLTLCALALFLAAHLVMVVLSGFPRQIAAMTFGRRPRAAGAGSAEP